MKTKIVALLLVFAMLLSMLLSCGGVRENSEGEEKNEESTQTTASQGGGDNGGDDEGDGEKKELYAYFLADLSASTMPLKEKLIINMEETLEALGAGGAVDVKLTVIPFSDNIYFTTKGADAMSEFKAYLDSGDRGIGCEETSVGAGLQYVQSRVESGAFPMGKIFIFSDGATTSGVPNLEQECQGFEEAFGIETTWIRVTHDTEIQLTAVDSNGRVRFGDTVLLQVVVNSSKRASGVTLVIEDGSIRNTRVVDLEVGENVFRFKYNPSTEGINKVRASLQADEASDCLTQNNVCYTWYFYESQRSILVVDGDADKDRGQLDQIMNSAVGDTVNQYNVDTVAPSEFPPKMAELLKYDQVILMDVNFDSLPSGASQLLKNYVEKVGRGLFVSFGDNFYNINSSDLTSNEMLLDILPVGLNLEGEEETAAMVLVLDLSSSMKEIMPGGEGKSRFETLVDSVKSLIMRIPDGDGLGLSDEDYLGVICFDQDFHIALEIQQLGDLENRWHIAEAVEYELRHYYYYYYLYPDGTESDVPVHKDDPSPSGVGTIQLIKPTISNTSNFDKDTGYYIRSYGTSYKWAIQAASDMLFEQSERTLLHIKHVLMMSDGAPNDKGSGYEGIVERMSGAGVVTSTISIGADTGGMDELKKIAEAGGGTVFEATNAEALLEEIIKKTREITNDYVNERPVLPNINSNSSVILQGVRELDQIGGYYPSTIKDGAELILYVDQMKPLYAEWEYGLGKVAVYMSDLGNPDWTGVLFQEDNENGNRLVGNMLTATSNTRQGASGITMEISYAQAGAVYVRAEYFDLPINNTLMVYLYDENGEKIGECPMNKLSSDTYSATAFCDKDVEFVRLRVAVIDIESLEELDAAELGVSFKYPAEYDVLTERGKILEDEDDTVNTNPKIAYIGKYAPVEGDTSSLSRSILYTALRAMGYTVNLEDMFADAEDAMGVSGYDLYIFEGITPKELPTDGAVWLIDSQESFSEGVTIEALKSEITDRLEISSSGKTAYEVFKNTDFEKPITMGDGEIYASAKIQRYISYSADYRPVFEVQGNTVMVVGEENGNPIIITTFDFASASLVAFIVDFPVLIKNMVNVCMK